MRVRRLAGILLAIAVTRWCAQAQAPVAVLNYADAPRLVLESAADSARMAFLAAHLDLRFRIGEDLAAQGPEELALFVMSKPRAPGEAEAGLHHAGYALENPAYPRAYAFLDVVREVSQRTTRPETEVMACVFIHEIGHLLGLRHRAHGAMRGDLDALEMDEVMRGRGFDAAESILLRAALRARWAEPGHRQ